MIKNSIKGNHRRICVKNKVQKDHIRQCAASEKVGPDFR